MHSQSNPYRDFMQALAADKELSSIYLRGIRDFSSLEDEELVRFTSALGVLFRVFGEAFFQWSEENLDRHVWHGFESPMTDVLASPGVLEWWSTRSHWYSTPFREFIRAKADGAGAPSLYGEPEPTAQ